MALLSELNDVELENTLRVLELRAKHKREYVNLGSKRFDFNRPCLLPRLNAHFDNVLRIETDHLQQMSGTLGYDLDDDIEDSSNDDAPDQKVELMCRQRPIWPSQETLSQKTEELKENHNQEKEALKHALCMRRHLFTQLQGISSRLEDLIILAKEQSVEPEAQIQDWMRSKAKWIYAVTEALNGEAQIELLHPIMCNQRMRALATNGSVSSIKWPYRPYDEQPKSDRDAPVEMDCSRVYFRDGIPYPMASSAGVGGTEYQMISVPSSETQKCMYVEPQDFVVAHPGETAELNDENLESVTSAGSSEPGTPTFSVNADTSSPNADLSLDSLPEDVDADEFNGCYSDAASGGDGSETETASEGSEDENAS